MKHSHVFLYILIQCLLENIAELSGFEGTAEVKKLNINKHKRALHRTRIGSLYYRNGDKYYGEWRIGKKNGKGIFYYNNGETYEGEWRNDKKSGLGIYHYRNGDVYEGDWKNDYRNGRGTYRWKNGNRYEGEWKNNESSSGIFYQSNGLQKEIKNETLFFVGSKRLNEKYKILFNSTSKPLLGTEKWTLYDFDKSHKFNETKKDNNFNLKGNYNYNNAPRENHFIALITVIICSCVLL